MTALSSWQIRQWATIRRVAAYTVTCRLCAWGDDTSSRWEAEDLYRAHWSKHHLGAEGSE